MISKLLIVLPVIGAVFWNILDCSPGLFFYDKIMTLTNPKIVASSLEGKTIWITGASSGIGASLVCQVMTAGAGHGKYIVHCSKAGWLLAGMQYCSIIAIYMDVYFSGYLKNLCESDTFIYIFF